jgi:hypothetical protein
MPSPPLDSDSPADGVDTGYDPRRVRALVHRTAEAIEHLRATRSDDVAAAEAMRTVRLTRRNLEDLWMPTLRQIERSQAMISWERSKLAGPVIRQAERRPAAAGASVWTSLSALSSDELVGYLEWIDRLAFADTSDEAWQAFLDRSGADLDVLAMELAARVTRDPSFAARLAAVASDHPLLGHLTRRAPFPVPFLSAVARSMMWPHGPRATADLEGFASSLSSVLASLVDHPAACLDLLMDPTVVYGVASWERLDADIVTEFTISGLHTAIAADTDRLEDGYRVIGTLVDLTNGALDGGIQPGVALGVAASLTGYIDTLAPAIRQEGPYPVIVIDHGLEVELGSYEDLVDLVGALLRHDEAQAGIGTVLGAYTTRIVSDLGADIGVRPGLEYVTRFADLVADASRTEQAELVMEAAAEEARRRQFGQLIGFGVNVTLSVGGVGSVTRSLVSRAVALATDHIAPVRAASLPDARVPSITYDLITFAALQVVAGNRVERHRAGLDAVPPSAWTELDRRLAAIEAEDDAVERTRKALRLDRWIETSVPLLAGHLGRIRSVPGMDELTEERTAARTDRGG